MSTGGPAGSPAARLLVRDRVQPEPGGQVLELGVNALCDRARELDVLVNRVDAQDLFDFEYFLEMYKPAHKRRWGYFALPILHDDRLVGKLDAIADRKASTLRVHAIHRDVGFTKAMTKAVHGELDALASWLGLDGVELAGV